MKQARTMRLFTTTLTTPVGDMMVLAGEEALCALEFVSPGRNVRLDGRRRRWFPPHTVEEGETSITRLTRAWLDQYFGTGAGATPPLAMYGTEFERRVWQALLEIPPGETSTYGAIARQLGVAGASRAVGLANGSNPIAIIVPCHRVIGSSGDLTGYGGGLDRKRWLLDHERQWTGGRLFT
jgi:O-6-methylguanine DNA methyltransferase